MLTVLFYLSTPAGGGETNFPLSQIDERNWHLQHVLENGGQHAVDLLLSG